MSDPRPENTTSQAQDGLSGLPQDAAHVKDLLFGLAETRMKAGGLSLFGGLFLAGTFLHIEPRDTSEQEREKLAMRMRIAVAAFDVTWTVIMTEVWKTNQARPMAEQMQGPPSDGEEAVVIQAEWPGGYQAHWSLNIKRDPKSRFAGFGPSELVTNTAGNTIQGRFAGFFPNRLFLEAERTNARIVMQANDPMFYRELERIAAKRKAMH